MGIVDLVKNSAIPSKCVKGRQNYDVIAYILRLHIEQYYIIYDFSIIIIVKAGRSQVQHVHGNPTMRFESVFFKTLQ